MRHNVMSYLMLIHRGTLIIYITDMRLHFFNLFFSDVKPQLSLAFGKSYP